ncbi:hypothetical protein I8751_16845 [Nostocaceae cyanobacterium CENA357]|uniref:Uncharacterized protein n=1 Tax=Atlanticothrix silvestris CENA357 TaxID=1725252 RepID=A0A8J7L3P4_9CYAN|nr:hypothetical protein [Atlanticothrix silvestris]MBH8554006.1 hypothetical protein [Atlanticothrix silvestris CENA357]
MQRGNRLPFKPLLNIGGLYKQSLKALQKGELEKALCLQFKAFNQHEKIILEWLRMQEIIRWLELDSELRSVGSNYPDSVEGE